MPQIRLRADQTPVIAYAIGSVNLGMGTWNGFLSLRVAQKATGGGWEIGEVFLTHPTYPEESGVDLYDMSFSMSPSGEMAVGFTYEMISGDPYAWYRYYHIMVNAGDGWQELFSNVSYAGSGNQDFKGQDIAHDSQGNLYALFTREDLGAPPDYSYEESIRLARWTGTGWDEKTLWDNSLYGARMGTPYYPALLMSSASVANIAYNGSSGIWFFARP